MNIRDVVYSVGLSGYFNKDLAAVKAGARPNGTFLEGKPLTPGYTNIVQAGAVVSVMLLLEDGSVAVGECADVIFSGPGRARPVVRSGRAPAGARIRRAALARRSRRGAFRANAQEIDRMEVDGRAPAHRAALRTHAGAARRHGPRRPRDHGRSDRARVRLDTRHRAGRHPRVLPPRRRAATGPRDHEAGRGAAARVLHAGQGPRSPRRGADGLRALHRAPHPGGGRAGLPAAHPPRPVRHAGRPVRHRPRRPGGLPGPPGRRRSSPSTC